MTPPAQDHTDRLPDLLILAPLAVEAAAARGGAPWAHVHRTGMGPRRSARSAELARQAAGSPVMIAGFCGALDPALDIAWPVVDGEPTLSDRDREAPTLGQVKAAGLLPTWDETRAFVEELRRRS